jgi:5-methyltetrahydropteroyltriglutamate--homocysteine methyltransferase
LWKEGTMQIPAYPTTTIGSFPQTKEIRKTRADFKAGRISAEEHDRLMDQFIAHTIGVQEGIDLDVLVHGEPERSDMCVTA